MHFSLAPGRSLGGDWRRRPRWTDQLRNDTGAVPANLRRQDILRGHSTTITNNNNNLIYKVSYSHNFRVNITAYVPSRCFMCTHHMAALNSMK